MTINDEAAIKQVVATVEQANNNEDVDEFVALFRADAIWTTGGGKRLFGRDEIEAFSRKVLPGGMAGLRVSMEPVHVLRIRPDVVAVKVRQRYESTDGQSSEVTETEGTPLFVMAKEGERWLLVACQNTSVVDS